MIDLLLLNKRAEAYIEDLIIKNQLRRATVGKIGIGNKVKIASVTAVGYRRCCPQRVVCQRHMEIVVNSSWNDLIVISAHLQIIVTLLCEGVFKEGIVTMAATTLTCAGITVVIRCDQIAVGVIESQIGVDIRHAPIYIEDTFFASTSYSEFIPIVITGC